MLNNNELSKLLLGKQYTKESKKKLKEEATKQNYIFDTCCNAWVKWETPDYPRHIELIAKGYHVRNILDRLPNSLYRIEYTNGEILTVKGFNTI